MPAKAENKPLRAKENRKGGRVRGVANIATLAGVMKEMGVIYREMHQRRRDHAEGRSLVWVLTQIRDSIEAAVIEARLDEIEKRVLQ